MAMTSDSPDIAPPRPRGFADVLRAFVRQLAAAVYVAIVYGGLAYVIGPHRLTWVIEPLVVLLGSSLTAFVIEGPWWTSSFVGLFVGLFDTALFVAFRGAGHGWRAVPPFAVPVVVLTLIGAVGALLGRALRRRKSTDVRP